MKTLSKILLLFFALLCNAGILNAQPNDFIQPRRNFNREEAGDYRSGRLRLKQLETVIEKIADKESQRYGLALQRLAEINFAMGDVEIASQNFIKSGHILHNDPGENTEVYIALLSDYSLLLLNRLKIDSARVISGYVQDIWKYMKAHNLPLSIDALASSGWLCAQLRDFKAATEFADAAEHSYELSSIGNAPDYQSLYRLGLLESQLKGTDKKTINFFNLAALALKDKVSGNSTGMNLYDIQDLQDDCNKLRSVLLGLLAEAPQQEGLVTSALQAEMLYENSLLLSDPKLSGFAAKKSWVFQPSELSRNLAADQVVMDIVRFDHEHDRSSGTGDYIAFIMYPGEDKAKFVPLFQLEELTALIYDNKGELKSADNLYNPPGDLRNFNADNLKLSKIIWGKLKPYIRRSTKTIYYSTDGSLSLINLGALADLNGYFADQYILQPLINLQSLWEINREKKFVPQSFSFIGGLDYGREPISVPSNDYRNWVRLKYSEVEVSSLRKITTDHGRTNVNCLTDTQATIPAFLRIISSHPDVLHISTHGFALPYSVKLGATSLDRKENYDAATNPLERFGLVLSLANNKKQFDDDNGLLTAALVAKVDLSTTKLVVLSACNTAEGDLVPGVGVFGLQRAFRSAGVRYMLVSLYPVDDKKTAAFMAVFYRNLVASDFETLTLAFQQALKEFRQLAMESESTAWANWLLLR